MSWCRDFVEEARSPPHTTNGLRGVARAAAALLIAGVITATLLERREHREQEEYTTSCVRARQWRNFLIVVFLIEMGFNE